MSPDQEGGPVGPGGPGGPGAMMPMSRSQMPEGMPGMVPESQQAMFAPQVSKHFV